MPVRLSAALILLCCVPVLAERTATDADDAKPRRARRPARPSKARDKLDKRDARVEELIRKYRAAEQEKERAGAQDADAGKRKPKRRRQATRPAKPKSKPTPETRSWLVRAERGMVASDSVEASKIGAEILENGGNAIDAAVATSFALGVTRPYSTGLGGGGFAVVYLSRTKETFAIDFRETAPADATWDMYVQARKKDPNAPAPSRFGGLAVAVPGLLAGAEFMLAEFGTMRLSDVVAPAHDLARDGFKPDAHYLAACRETLKRFQQNPTFAQKYAVLYRTLLNSGQPIKTDQVIQRHGLADALRLIMLAGPTAFYEGRIAEAVVQAVKDSGGVIAFEDLLAYRVREREPIRFKYRDYEVVSMPPPSSGGVVIAEALNILSHTQLASVHAEEPGLAAHRFVEACKHAFADRSRWLGDPAYVKIPLDVLTGPKYAESLAKAVNDEKTRPTKSYGSVSLKDDGGTSHFCVVDADDNVVAWTETINLVFGSFVVAEPFGIVLNNEMDDFSAEPGKPDAFGLRTSFNNAVAPGKRPLSSMSPTIVLDPDGLPVLTLGASGGPRIISSVLNVLVNVLDYGMTLGEAVEVARIHHQWMPNEIRFSDRPDGSLIAALRKRGHRVSKRRSTGIVQAVEWTRDNALLGASDPRKGGRPAGH